MPGALECGFTNNATPTTTTATTVPDPGSFSVRDVARVVGPEAPVPVMDVERQVERADGWTLGKWVCDVSVGDAVGVLVGLRGMCFCFGRPIPSGSHKYNPQTPNPN